MLQASTLDLGGNWKEHLPLVEFAYNNSFHSSIGWCLFKLYMGRSVGRLFVGMKLVKGNYWGQNDFIFL